MSDYHQYTKIALAEAKTNSGIPAVALTFPEAKAMVLFDDPQSLENLAKHIQEWAAQLVVMQRKGVAVIYAPPSYRPTQERIGRN